MCGRFDLHHNPDAIALQFAVGLVPAYQARYNVAPGSDVLAVCAGAQGRAAHLSRWGLAPAWARDAAAGLANVRGDTVAAKFRSAFRRGRCLVPASGFYEWRNVGRRKLPHYVAPADAPLFALAAVSEPRAGRQTLALVTTQANEAMLRVHDRMPVIVPPEAYAAWLDAGSDVDALQRLLRPYPAERMRIHPVGTAVSDARSEGPSLIEPLEPDQMDLV